MSLAKAQIRGIFGFGAPVQAHPVTVHRHKLLRLGSTSITVRRGDRKLPQDRALELL